MLRGLLPGRPTADSLFSDVLNDGASLLKVWQLLLLACRLLLAAVLQLSLSVWLQEVSLYRMLAAHSMHSCAEPQQLLRLCSSWTAVTYRRVRLVCMSLQLIQAGRVLQTLLCSASPVFVAGGSWDKLQQPL